MKKLTKAGKRKQRRLLIIAVISFILIVVMFKVWEKLDRNTGKDKENSMEGIDYFQYNVPEPGIKQMLLTQNVNSRPGTSLGTVNGVVIHYTANPGTDAEANRNYFEGRKDEPDEASNKVSSHYIIGLDGTIIQCIPLDEIAYASNNRNADTISIECCHPDKSGKFSKDTYNSLVHLTGWLCGKYNLDKNSVIRHYDVTGKECPLYFVKNNDAWDKLKNDIWKFFLSCKKEKNKDKK